MMSQNITPAVGASHRAISDASQASSSSSETGRKYAGLDLLFSLSKEAPCAANGSTRSIRLCVARGPQRVIGGDARPPNTPLTVCTHLVFWASLWSKRSFSNPLPPSFFLATLVFVAESGLFSSCGVQAPQLRCLHPLVVMHASSSCDVQAL